MSTPAVDSGAIARTLALIRPYVRRTPVLEFDRADLGLPPGAPVTAKLEFTQHAGSFKTRGAFANLLLRDVPDAGVVAASGGNHGAAVAYAARRREVPATIFVPTVSSPAKVSRIRGFGADLHVGGDLYADALAASLRWAGRSGALPVHAFDSSWTIGGTGTVGLELQDQAPGLDTVLVAVGGGGLIAGIAAWYEGRARVVGVEPETAPTLWTARKAGEPVDAPAGGVAADSLAPRRVGELVFPITQQYVEDVVLVPDEAILAAQRTAWDALRIVVEPGAATALAALTSGAYVPAADERVGVILSGANTTAVRFD
jgi:threonine dehydratase